jgi:hypothetical protein
MKKHAGLGGLLFWWAVVLLVCWGMAGWLVVMAARGIRDECRAAESTSWPQASGQVLASSCEHPPGYRGMRAPDVRIRYRYQVDGRTIEGSRTNFRSSLGEAACRTMVERFPVGQAVMVSYRPDEVTLSVLQPGQGPSLLLLATAGGAGLLLTTISLFLTWFALQSLRGGKGKRTRTPTRRARRSS